MLHMLRMLHIIQSVCYIPKTTKEPYTEFSYSLRKSAERKKDIQGRGKEEKY